MSGNNYSQLQYCACFNIRKASRTITQLFDHALKPVGLKVTQFTILGVLANSGEITINNLSSVLGMDRTTLTRGLERLEKEKLISSREGEDARQRNVQLSDHGFSVLDSAIPHWEKAQRAMQKGFGDAFPDFLNNLSESSDVAVNG